MTDIKADVKAKKVRRQLGVECMMDIGVPAVFYCSRCKKPFCEDCIGREAGGKTFCIHCAGVEESIEDEARSGPSLAFVKKKGFLFPLFAVAATIVIAFNSYILYNDYIESSQTVAVEPDASPQLMGIAECRMNLEVLAAEALSYSTILGRPPSSLEELLSILAAGVKIEDPVSSKRYIIESNAGGNIAARCPTPEDHGVGGIVALPGKPARVTYTNERGQP